MAVEFWTRRQPVTFYPSKGKGRNNPFSFENFKTFVGYLSHTVAFAFGTRDPDQNVSLVTPSLLLTEQISQLLDEAVEKTGKTQEEILHCCLEHGIHKILKGTETGT